MTQSPSRNRHPVDRTLRRGTVGFATVLLFEPPGSAKAAGPVLLAGAPRGECWLSFNIWLFGTLPATLSCWLYGDAAGIPIRLVPQPITRRQRAYARWVYGDLRRHGVAG